MISKKTITLREAYEKGRRTQRTHADWDDAVVRFSNKYCAPHSPSIMCGLEHAWANGFDDAGEDNRDRQPSK